MDLMKTRFLSTIAAALAVTLSAAPPAAAITIAGWDFSQYFSSGELSTDAASYTNVLDANYSNLLAAPGAGPGASDFGTLFFDGSYGSTSVDPSSGSAQLTPASESLVSNINAPQTSAAFVPFDSLTTLDDAGQEFQNALSLQIQNTVSFVFAAYLDTVPGLGSDWSISFGGQTLSGTALVDIAFSTNGTTFTPAGQQTLTSVDSPFVVSLAGAPSDAAFVRFTVNPAGGLGARIDNVSLNGTIVVVPEPGTLVLLGVSLGALALIGRRQRA
jgi:hypothetical protein